MKCMTAPNDFEMDSFQGIPDKYDGRVLTKRHVLTGTLTQPAAGQDIYYVLLPTPGVAYWYGTRAVGTTAAITLLPVYYSDTTTLFPAGEEGSVVSGFRYASNAIEIMPTVNAMNWTGALSVWKFKPSFGAVEAGSAGTFYTVAEGFDAMNSVKPESVLPYNNGCYIVTAPSQPELPFSEVWKGTAPSLVICHMDGAGTALTFGGTGNMIGFGTQEGVIIKNSYVNGSNSALVRTWACVEYAVSSTSVLYEYTHISPAYDPVAMALVRKFIHAQPTAVAFFENENYWKRFLGWVKEVSGSLKVVPGVVGEVAGIANLIADTTARYSGMSI